jgi:hypothetical protein
MYRLALFIVLFYSVGVTGIFLVLIYFLSQKRRLVARDWVTITPKSKVLKGLGHNYS